MIKVFCDGSCTNNGVLKGVGGWGYYIQSENFEVEDLGGMLETTNNRMEMEAVLQALRQLYDMKHMFRCNDIMFYCDSDLLVKSLSKNATYEQKKNLDKWLEINKAINKLERNGFNIDFQWIKAHTNESDELTVCNRKVDKLATMARDKMKKDMEVIIKLKGLI